jgi:hypothetical protein
MRFVAAGVKAFRPFSRLWVFLCAAAVFLTFGLGGGTPNTTTWLIGKFLLLGVLLTSLMVELASQVRDWLTRTN